MAMMEKMKEGKSRRNSHAAQKDEDEIDVT